MSLRFLAIAATAGLLIGCDAGTDVPAEPPTPIPTAPGSAAGPQPPEPAAVEPATVPPIPIAGEYRVAGVDGGDIDLPHGISASIGRDRIEVSSQCVEMAWSYRFEGDRLVTETVPVVTCDRARYPEEEAIEAAFTAARQVERTATNGLRLSGGGRSVTLFSQ